MLRLEVKNGTRTDYSVKNDGALILGTRLYVPGDEALKREKFLWRPTVRPWPCMLAAQKLRFGKWGKLSPRYIGPIAYGLSLPLELSRLHNVFHVSMLRKYISNPSHVLESQLIELKDDLSYVEQPVQILDWKIQVLCSREIPLVKVLWRSHVVEESTWEPEEQMRT
ncbi:hypothetical protein L3X38_011418 [Prunus dulcis]|uniref:Tf2-1-like SH3-like domain-containing protein n=1 Tax=Prunus dulcis TaxID=3755 RepID=A0AAD4WJM6_PRUDU|nr:hypothetical protein L3X38_011418 [Prunus dulcis]